MKSKKIMALLLAGSMVMSLAACMPKVDRDIEDDKQVEESGTTEEETTEEETTTTTAEETTSEETTSEETTSEETTSEAIASEESKESEATSASAKSGSFKGKIVDFKDMHFYVNGKKYTLGKTTLQEMIDDGVPFSEKSIKNASQEMKKNSQSLNGFSIELDKFWSAQIYVMNLSSSAKPMNQCVIYKISLPSIDSHYKNGANLSFDFPIEITQEEVIANAGEPKKGNKTHYEGDNGYYTDTYRYTEKSKKYLGSKEYSFEFKKGEISRILISYMP